MRAQLMLDRPLPIQFLQYLRSVLQGDFGYSLQTNQPAIRAVLERMPATLQLALAGFILAILVALPIGVFAGVRRGTLYDRVSMVVALVGQAIPAFWLALLLILLFSVQLRLLPPYGYGSLSHFVLPVVSLASVFTARSARIVRSSVVQVMGQDYVRTARAKGLDPARVLMRHVLPNALIPIVTVFGLDLVTIIGGAVVVETVFAWPGVGRLMVDAVLARDFPVVQAGVILIAGGLVFVNMAVDVAYLVINPRLR